MVVTIRAFARRHLYGVRVLLYAGAVFLVAVPFGLILEQVLTLGPLTETDQALAERLHGFFSQRDVWQQAAVLVTNLGDPRLLYALGAGVCLVMLAVGMRRLAMFVAVTGVVGGLVNLSVKLAVGRPRPVFDEPLLEAWGRSFPSGHTTLSTIVYGAILLALLPLVARRWRPVPIVGVMLLVVAIGFSRMALGVHFVSDVAAGMVLGTAWLALSTAAFELWRVERGVPRTNPLMEGVEPEEVEQAVEAGSSRGPTR